MDEHPAGVNMQPVLKSGLKRLFDHQPFTNALSCSISEKPFLDVTEFEPIFVCIAKMVQNIVEENTPIEFYSMREHHGGEHLSRRIEDSREEQISEKKRRYEEYRLRVSLISKL
ncbi:hypothetical protein Bca101_025680 [Brassica carinata]